MTAGSTTAIGDASALQAQNASKTQNSSSQFRWLVACSDMFATQQGDSKDVVCMTEVIMDRAIRMEGVLNGRIFALSAVPSNTPLI